VRVVAALIGGFPFGEVGDVGQAARVEMRPVVQHHDDVRAGSGLDRGGDARLQVVGVDGLERDLDLRLLLVLGDLASDLDVALGDEVHPLQQVDLRALGEGRRPAGAQDAFEPGGGAGDAGGFQEGAAMQRDRSVGAVGSVHGPLLARARRRRLVANW
jgi:hypothetical protein